MRDVDEYGFILTFDAILAMIPIFIIILSVVNTTCDYNNINPENRFYHEAHDTVELMAKYHGTDGLTILEEISNELSDNSNSINRVQYAKEKVDPFLNKTLGGTNYSLVEVNQLNGKEITSKGNISKAKNVAVAVKYYRNYVFKLYVGE